MLSESFQLLLTLGTSSIAIVFISMLFAEYFPRLLDLLGL